MKRGGPLKRTSSLKRSGGLSGGAPLKRTEINQRSEKRQRLMTDDRIPLIERLVAEGHKCEIGPVLAAHDVLEGRRHCRGKIEGLHELRKRSAGGSLLNPDNLVPACNYCNGWVEQNPSLAWELGLVLRAGDPDYERLGARHDRSREDVQGQDVGGPTASPSGGSGITEPDSDAGDH